MTQSAKNMLNYLKLSHISTIYKLDISSLVESAIRGSIPVYISVFKCEATAMSCSLIEKALDVLC